MLASSFEPVNTLPNASSVNVPSGVNAFTNPGTSIASATAYPCRMICSSCGLLIGSLPFSAQRMLNPGSLRSSHLGHTAVDEQLGTVDKARVWRCEEQNRRGHLLGRADATQGNQRRHLSGECLDLLAGQARCLVALCWNHASAHCVDANAALLQVDGPTTRERPNGRFA